MPNLTDTFFAEIAEGQERFLRGSQRRFQRSITNYLNAYRRNLQRYVNGKMGRRTAVNKRMFDAFTTARDLRAILEDSGLSQMVDLHFAELNRLERQALTYFKKAGITDSLAGISKTAVKAYASYSEYEIRRVMESRLVEPVQNMLLATSLGETSRDELVKVVAKGAAAEQIKVSRSSIETTINDLHRGYQRHVTNVKAKELGLDLFIYRGPLDKITSEQCEHLLLINRYGVEGLLPRNEISSDLHPKLPRGSNPLVNGGHINCRHKYYPITQEEAERRGYKP